MISQGNIDNDYIKILEERIIIYNRNSNEVYNDIIDVDVLLNIGRYIDGLKPKSKYRNYKIQLIHFIDVLESNTSLSKKEVVALVQEHLADLFILLKSKHSFVGRHDWFWRVVFAVFIDLILIAIGLAKYYYYIPIITCIVLTRNISKLRKAKTEGRYIDF